MSKDLKESTSVVEAPKDKQGMNRRKVIGSLAVVGGVSAMPTSWVKPVVNSVILPVHAQTSATDSPTTESEESNPPPVTSQGLILSTTQTQAGSPLTIQINSTGPDFSGGNFLINTDIMSIPATGDDNIIVLDAEFSDSDGSTTQIPIPVSALEPGDQFTTPALSDSLSNNFTITVTNLGVAIISFDLTLL